MSWEDWKGGALDAPTEAEPDIIETASMVEAQQSADDRTLETFARLVQETPAEIVTEYDGTLGNNRGSDEVLEKFIADNEQYMSQAQADRFKKSFRTANLFARSARAEGDMIPSILPMIQHVLQQKRVQQQSTGGIDAVPSNIQPYVSGDVGRIAFTKHQDVTKMKKELTSLVLSELRSSDEYGIYQGARHQEQSVRGSNPRLEAARVTAHIVYNQKHRQILEQYNRSYDGIFEASIKNLTKSIHSNQTRLTILHQQIHGHGYSQAMSQSMGRREMLRSRSRSEELLRLRGGAPVRESSGRRVSRAKKTQARYIGVGTVRKVRREVRSLRNRRAGSTIFYRRL